MAIKAKKVMTSIDIAVEVQEIKAILPLRVANIYDTPSKGVLIKFRSRKPEQYSLIVIEPSKRIHLTKTLPPRPHHPSPFVMGLRKYLRNTLINDISQLGFDRIVVMEFSSRVRLVSEILPRGVISLIDEDNNILYVSRPLKARDRTLKIGLKYSPPPNIALKPPNMLRLEDVTNALAKGRDVVRSLVRGLMLPGEFIEEVLHRAGIGLGEKTSSIDRETAEIMLNGLKELYEESLKNKKGYIAFENETPITVTPFKPKGISEVYGFIVKEYKSFTEALDTYFTQVEKAEMARKALEELEKKKKRLEASYREAVLRLEEQEKELKNLQKIMVELGEALPELYSAIECIERKRRPCSPIIAVDDRTLTIKLKTQSLRLPLNTDPGKYLIELSRKIGELESKIRRAKSAITDLEKQIKELEDEKEKIATIIIARIKKREWYERYHWLVTSSGILAIGGRNASQNEAIVKKYLTNNRIFMHADIHGAPVVVLFSNGSQVSEADLREAAVLTAAYSRAWKEKIGAVDVYWVLGSQVSKTPPPGEYLRKGAFMVYGRRNYIYNVETVLSLGIGLDENSPLIIVGPEHLVEKRSIVYATLVPGDHEPGIIAKTLKRRFLQIVDSSLKQIMDVVRIEDIRERLPGFSRIVKVSKGDNSEHPRGRLGEFLNMD